jgi:P4 family phage/plasmid primase-like protien
MTDTTTETRNTEVTRFWRHLFGGQSGLLMVLTGVRDDADDIPKETIVSNVFNYPKAEMTAAAWALEKSEKGREVYFCAHLLTAPRRIKANASEVITLWGDLDGVPIPNGKLKPTAVVESSPGRYHAYWRLADAIPPKTAEDLNRRIADKVGADASGFDLSQLLRVPGTLNHKYDGTPVVRLVDLEGGRAYSAGDLDKLLPREPGERPGASSVSHQILNGQRNKELTSLAGTMRRRGMDEAEILVALEAVNARRCVPPLGAAELKGIAKSMSRYKPAGNGASGSPSGRDDSKPPTPTHDELRDRFIGENRDFSYGLGEWRQYEGGIWPPSPELKIKRRICGVIEAAKTEGIKPTNSLLSSVTELTRVEIAVSDAHWDADPDILVCNNGALRISTHKLEPHKREHYATSAVPYDYDPRAVSVVWNYFMNSTVPAAATFLQEFAGYALTTDMSHELALWLFGPPGSGKSTFLAGLQAMLGHRAGLLGLAEIERNRFALADLPGKTLVAASEQPSSYLASTNILNAIISGESLQVERKYRDPVTVLPRCKIAWAMNELPRVADANSGLFRRVKVVKFPKLPTNERDPEIKNDIEGEGAGILNWALGGLERLKKRGRFEVPGEVEEATTQFREKNDVPALFVADRCTIDPEARVKARELYQEYKFWCEDNGHRPQSSTRLADDWQRLGFERKRTKTGTYYQGVRVRLPNE